MVGAARDTPKKRRKSRTYALTLGALLGLCPGRAAAGAKHVQNQCPRLSGAAYEELDARVLLLVASEGGVSELPTVVCTPADAWVEWRGKRLPVAGRGSLVDDVVDVVEKELHEAERAEEADPKTTEDLAVAAGQPMLERGAGSAPPPPSNARPADPIAARAVDARGGGIAVGLESELVSDSMGIAMGPSFDFASSVGPLLLGGREAFRFTLAGRRVALMDFQASAGYGAPFNPDARFGVVMRFGAEWMIAYPEGNSGQAAIAPIADLGLRVAHSFGLVGLWFGVDARLRTQSLSLQSRGKVTASDVSGSLTLGVAFVDWSRK